MVAETVCYFFHFDYDAAGCMRPASGKRCEVIGRELQVRGQTDQLSMSTNNKYGKMTGLSSFFGLLTLTSSDLPCYPTVEVNPPA